MTTIKAKEWIFDGEIFAKEISTMGDASKWIEVSDEFKAQWEAEHPAEVGDMTDSEMLNEINDIVNG